MSGLKKMFSAPPFIGCVLLLGVMALSALACSASGTPTEAPVIPTQPPTPAAEEADTPPPTEAAPETAPEAAADMNIVGFWRGKVVSKQVIVFEFQEGGQTIWHYHIFNGDKSETAGTYSLQGDLLTVVIGEPQDLTMQMDGDMLTLTGPDGTPLTLHKVANLDDPGPTASTNISADIVNRWQDTAVQEWIEFMADGKVSITSDGNVISGTYTVNGSNMEMKVANQDKSTTYSVEINGDVLTLYAQDGSFIDYVK